MKNVTFPPMARGGRSDWTKSCQKIKKIRISHKVWTPSVRFSQKMWPNLARDCQCWGNRTGLSSLLAGWTGPTSHLHLACWQWAWIVVLKNQERRLPPHTGISCKILPLLSYLPVSTPGEEKAQERGRGEVVWQKKSFLYTPKFSAPD